MPKLTKTEPEFSSQTKPTVRQLRQDVEDTFMQAGYSAGYVRFFMDEICSPYQPVFEHPHMASVQGAVNATRWVEPYRERISDCQRTYLAMSETDRNLLHAGVEDGVKWRGEPVAQYQDIWNETMRMREIGREAYIAEAKAKMGVLDR